MRQRRETIEHPFGTIKSWMGATHFQMRTLKRVATEMALHVLAYNLKRAMSILGIGRYPTAFPHNQDPTRTYNALWSSRLFPSLKRTRRPVALQRDGLCLVEPHDQSGS